MINNSQHKEEDCCIYSRRSWELSSSAIALVVGLLLAKQIYIWGANKETVKVKASPEDGHAGDAHTRSNTTTFPSGQHKAAQPSPTCTVL